MITDELAKLLGRPAAYGGSCAAFAYLLFKRFGESWIENRFAQRLEQVRHQQALELQKLRVEIDALLSGAIKLQEREFAVLPEVWARLDEAHSIVDSLTSPVQVYADVDRMAPAQLEEFLSRVECVSIRKERYSGEAPIARSKGIEPPVAIWE